MISRRSSTTRRGNLIAGASNMHARARSHLFYLAPIFQRNAQLRVTKAISLLTQDDLS